MKCNGFKKYGALIAVLLYMGCYPAPQTYYYLLKKNLFLNGIEIPAPIKSKSMVFSGWAESVPPEYKTHTSDLVETIVEESNSVDTINTWADTSVEIPSIPRLRFGADIGFAFNARLAFGGTVLISANFDSLPADAHARGQFEQIKPALGLWCSFGNNNDPEIWKPRLRITIRTLLSSEEYYTFTSSDYILPDSTMPIYSLVFRPSFGAMLPIGKIFGVISGISAAAKIQTLNTESQGAQLFSVAAEGALVYAGFSLSPVPSISISPYFECAFISLHAAPIPMAGINLRYLHSFGK